MPTLTPTWGVCDAGGQQVFGGMLVGALVGGGMADTLGRKPVCAPPSQDAERCARSVAHRSVAHQLSVVPCPGSSSCVYYPARGKPKGESIVREEVFFEDSSCVVHRNRVHVCCCGGVPESAAALSTLLESCL